MVSKKQGGENKMACSLQRMMARQQRLEIVQQRKIEMAVARPVVSRRSTENGVRKKGGPNPHVSKTLKPHSKTAISQTCRA
jgi:hypothetical protein